MYVDENTRIGIKAFVGTRDYTDYADYRWRGVLRNGIGLKS
jgi:hypothetical protein